MSGSNPDAPPAGWYPAPDGGERWWDGAQFTDAERPANARPDSQEHPEAVTVLVLGILGLVLCGILGPVAWVKGNRVVREIDAAPSRYTNRGQAQAGRILGIVSSILLIIGVLVVVASMLLVAAGRSSDSSNSSGVESPGTATESPTENLGPSPTANWQGPVGDAVGMGGEDAQARASADPGVYIWADFGGWHVRSNNTSEVTVTVAADEVRVNETDDPNEEPDSPYSTEEVVTLPAGGGTTGVGLDLGTSESVTITVLKDGNEVSASEIKLGGADGVADQNPVTFIKS